LNSNVGEYPERISGIYYILEKYLATIHSQIPYYLERYLAINISGGTVVIVW